MAQTYRFKGVPKTFTTKQQALNFLANSPGYVKRRDVYLRTYWPGLMQELEKGAVSNKPARTRGQLAAGALAGMKTSGPGLFDAIGSTGAKAGKALINERVGQRAARATPGLIKATPGAVKANVNWMADLARSDPKTQEATLDFAIGKGLTNLAQGQPPKNWQDVAGLGVGVAGILPVGRFGVRGGETLKAALGAEKADKALDVGKAAEHIAAPGAPIGPKTLNETVQDALSGAPEAIAAQNKLYSQERAIRAQGAMKAYYDAGGGTAGRNAALGELKGALPKIEWNGFTEFNPETADQMVRHIFEETDLRFYDALRASKGLDRMMAGRPPQENQRLLLEGVFGKGNIDAISAPTNRGVLGFLHEHGLQLWNTPRTLMASFDMSAPFRQGLVAGARHPVIFAKNFKPMVRAWGSEDVARGIMDDIAERANFPRYQKAKLALTDAAGDTALREEQFPPGLLDKAPGVKHSARAYSAFLDKMRVDIFDRMIDLAESQGKNADDAEFLDALGRYINAATGRGKLPSKTAEKAAPFLNSFLFSPRLMASRIAVLNPAYYVNLYRQSPFVAKQAAMASVNTLAGVSAMLYLASNIPGVKVGVNPLSADFGKIRVGNTRIDVAGGFQQYLVLYTRLAMGKSVSSSTGKTQNLKGGYGDSSRGDVLWRFVQGKFAPSAGMIRDALEGQTFIGEPLTPQGMAYNNLTPLNVQGGIELYNTEGSIPAAIGGGLLSSIGFGVNSYPDKAASQTTSRATSKRSNKPGSRVSNKPSRRRSNKP